jgi:hypothetical protein
MATSSENATLANQYATHAEQDAVAALQASEDAYQAAALEVSLYWDFETNEFKAYNTDTASWEVVHVDSFQGSIDGGTVSVPNHLIQIKRDTAGNWFSNNPILAIGEVGFETDTKYLKVGNGTSAWNDLSYIQIPSANVIGFENVDNTADIDKPVSTLQQTAIDDSLQLAKDYSDVLRLETYIDKGEYDASGDVFPTTALRGDTYLISVGGTLGSLIVEQKDTLRALIDDPGQSESNWLVIPAKENIVYPYIVSGFIYDKPQENDLVLLHVFVTNVSFPQDLVGSKVICRDVILTTSTTKEFKLYKNYLEIGSINFTTDNLEATYTFNNSVSFIAGDTLQIMSPTSQDPNLKHIAISLLGTRT